MFYISATHLHSKWAEYLLFGLLLVRYIPFSPSFFPTVPPVSLFSTFFFLLFLLSLFLPSPSISLSRFRCTFTFVSLSSFRFPPFTTLCFYFYFYFQINHFLKGEKQWFTCLICFVSYLLWCAHDIKQYKVIKISE